MLTAPPPPSPLKEKRSHEVLPQPPSKGPNVAGGSLLPFDRKKVSQNRTSTSILPDSGSDAGARTFDTLRIKKKPPWRPRAIASSNQLLDRFASYAAYIKEHPFQELQLFAYQNQIFRVTLKKARPMTLTGFCLFLGISPQAWRYWRKHRKDLFDVVELIEDIIYVQKFEGAAAGIFRANIISRELGMSYQA